MGKGSSDTKTNSSSFSTMSPDSNAYQAYLALLNRSKGVADTPYQGYGGEQVAPINEQQTAGVGNINRAQGTITATGAPIGASDIQRYMDPYTNEVINATQADFDVQNERGLSQVKGNAAAQGALGGDREAVAAALTKEGQTRAQAPVIAGLRSRGYESAVKTAEDQQQQALRAGVAGLQGAQAQFGVGTAEQQTQQAQDTQNRMDYYQKQGYPFQVAQWLAAIDTGVGSQMGGTSSTIGSSTTTGPQPNQFAQAAGLGLAGASMFLERGGRVSGVHRFAEGGGVDDDSASFDERFHGERPSPATMDIIRAQMRDMWDTGRHVVGALDRKDYHPMGHFKGVMQRGYAGGGGPTAPWAEGQSWVPTVGGITGGKGAPSAPSLPQAPGASKQQSGLSADQMKGIGTLGKKAYGSLDNYMNTGDRDVSLADLGSATNPLLGMDAYDYEGGGFGGNEMFAARGGRIASFADGGIPIPREDPREGAGRVRAAYRDIRETSAPSVLEDIVGRFSESKGQSNALRDAIRRKAVGDISRYPDVSNALEAYRNGRYSDGGRVRRYARGGGPQWLDDASDAFDHYPPMAAGVGSARPAFGGEVINPDEPFRLLDRPEEGAEPPALENWRSGVRRDIRVGQSAQDDDSLPPEVVSGRSKPPVMAAGTAEEGDEGPSEAMGYAGRPRLVSGVGAPAAAPEGAPDEGFLSRLGIKMTPELKQGMLQAGLSMMANRHGGAGSFLQAAGEAGMAGVGAYSQTQQLAQQQAEKARKEAFEREKFERPFSQLTAAQQETARHNKVQEAKEFKPTWGVIRKDIDENTGFSKDVYGWIDPNTKQIIEGPAPKGTAAAAAQPTVEGGGYDYSKNAPRVDKGTEVPEPKGLSGKSAASVKADAEYYAQTGKLPPVRAGQSPVAVVQQNYRNAVQNYGNALAESRGINPSQLAEMWRTAPGQLRFVLGADGRATVSLGTAVRHLDTIQQLADAWGSGDVQAINRVKAAIARQFGDSSVTNLESAASIVGPEIIKALGVAGAGTEHDRTTAASQFSAARSPSQIKDAVKTVQALLGGQLEGKKRQAAAAGVSEEKFKSLIGDRPYEILSGAEKGHGTKGKELSAADKQAMDWANANPKDPRAAEIKKRLGVQ